jgi:hypothetical protein
MSETARRYAASAARSRFGARDDDGGLRGGVLEAARLQRRAQLGVRGEPLVGGLGDGDRRGQPRQQDEPDQRRSKR